VPKFIEEDEDRQGAGQGQEEEEEEVEEEEVDKLAADDESDPRVQAKKAKIGQMWELLNSRPGGAPSKQPKAAPGPQIKQAPAGSGGGPTAKAGTASSSLAALCRPAKPSKARSSDEVRAGLNGVTRQELDCERGIGIKQRCAATLGISVGMDGGELSGRSV